MRVSAPINLLSRWVYRPPKSPNPFAIPSVQAKGLETRDKNLDWSNSQTVSLLSSEFLI